MPISRGTHWQGPLLGASGVNEDVPAYCFSAQDTCQLFFDYIDTNDNSACVTTVLGGTAGAIAAQPGGIFRLTTGAVDGQGVQTQLANGAQAFLRPSTADMANGNLNREISFLARLSVTDYSDSSWFVGLGGVDSTFMLATGLLATTGFDNGVGFHHLAHANSQGGVTGPDPGNDLRLVTAGTAVANYSHLLLSAANVPKPAAANADVDTVYHDYGIRIIGTNIAEWYLDGILRHRRVVPNAYAAAVTPTFCIITGPSGASNVMEIDYWWASATRARTIAT